MRRIDKVIVHCSDSSFGDAAEINAWHKERGFDEIGYHYVILNGRRKGNSTYDKSFDGVIEKGRDMEKDGAHCLGQNRVSVGVCLIGREAFTPAQLFDAFPKLLVTLIASYGLKIDDVYGHYEFEPKKTCPNIDMRLLRKALKGVLA